LSVGSISFGIGSGDIVSVTVVGSMNSGRFCPRQVDFPPDEQIAEVTLGPQHSVLPLVQKVAKLLGMVVQKIKD
jgi:hypothetical protein